MRQAVKDAWYKLNDVGIGIEGMDDAEDYYKIDFYDGGEYLFFPKSAKRVVGQYYNSSYEEFFAINSSSANYCCGIPELGNYDRHRSKNSVLTNKNLVLCFNYIKVQENTGYFQMYTTSRACDRWINNVLPKAGFRKKVTLPSKQGQGRYKVIAWDWLKEYDNEG